MAGSYLGHGAKYWADRYFESQTQTHLPDDPADLSWRDKYLALEKECSSYQATLADLRTEVEYLRTQRSCEQCTDAVYLMFQQGLIPVESHPSCPVCILPDPIRPSLELLSKSLSPAGQ